ncbi:xanthine dehydrogenase family protein molybdopterin-binding subunit [Pseudorhodoferax sp. Leaf265]|uniref:xanthine dehydrogenase family protein molybdopterin-binding subunit n=1 Tax=Pseudorhodoferax sp. Leaf265 TaxID=1736315 RepID=UPI0006F51279|nr:xanthine dehydrogenase family protein molybdopterin-binding subunit [Pseudorhodoferax sp. Leaf265]KQP19302.1 aldehyde oxidase [Pseudorhodoferax sp. Leaf265]
MADPKHPAYQAFKYIGKHRRAVEHRRFVTGQGRYAADVVPAGLLHVAIVASPYASARILSIDTSAALAMPGVHTTLTGEELNGAVDPMLPGVDAPKVARYPLARGMVRYAGEWVVAVVADSRAQAEDAAEMVMVEYEQTPCTVDPEAAMELDAPRVHPDHGSNIIWHRKFTWGPVDEHFASAEHQLSYRVRWARSSTVPIETFVATCSWNDATQILDVWASIQMPKYPDLLAKCLRLPGNGVRVHYDVDVGGSYGVKRGLKHTILVGYLSMMLGRPVRFLEDRLENMRGGDMQGPDRIFDVTLAFDSSGDIRSMRMRAVDDIGAYSGRSPLQLGKPVGAIVGPYRIASVEYDAYSILTHKTPQEAVRGFGQAPTNYAIESGIDKVARFLGMDRVELRRKNLIQKDQFPYLICSGTTYDSGDYEVVMDKALEAASYHELLQQRDALRARGLLAGIGVSTCLEPSGGNSAFEPLFNPKNETTTWMDACLIRIDLNGAVTALMGTSSSGQAHETLVSTVIGEVLQREPDSVRVLHADSLNALPSNSPVGSRMAIMLGGAAAGAAKILKAKLITIAAHNMGVAEDDITYEDGDAFVTLEPARRLRWDALVEIAHRKYHCMPDGMEPGLQEKFCWEVPSGGRMPTEDGRVQMYPCHSFESHVVLASIDAETGKTTLHNYAVGHDCGVMISPDVVHGMTYGGVAHGLGAALLEKFAFSDEGQLLSGTFMDYLLPSAQEVPSITIVDHCTPSPLTVFGQKGSGEAGYLGSPAAIAGAINDALAPAGVSIDELPMTPQAVWRVLRAAKEQV